MVQQYLLYWYRSTNTNAEVMRALFSFEVIRPAPPASKPLMRSANLLEVAANEERGTLVPVVHRSVCVCVCVCVVCVVCVCVCMCVCVCVAPAGRVREWHCDLLAWLSLFPGLARTCTAENKGNENAGNIDSSLPMFPPSCW
jgi:hypothetical protein